MISKNKEVNSNEMWQTWLIHCFFPFPQAPLQWHTHMNSWWQLKDTQYLSGMRVKNRISLYPSVNQKQTGVSRQHEKSWFIYQPKICSTFLKVRRKTLVLKYANRRISGIIAQQRMHVWDKLDLACVRRPSDVALWSGVESSEDMDTLLHSMQLLSGNMW